MNLNSESPYILRLWGYLQQRYPIQNALLFFILFISTQVFSSFVNDQSSFSFGVNQVLGFVSVYFLFFTLRVIDEHKDYDVDCLNHHDRVLQKGLVSLGQLKNIAIVGVIFQAGYSFSVSALTFYCWLITFGFALLMAKDFFIGRYLHKHLFVMMFTHAPVTPLAIIWMMSMSGEIQFSSITISFILTCLSCGIAFEISRKIKTPEDEVKTVDSYSQVVGYKLASVYSLFSLLISTVLLCFILNEIDTQLIIISIPVLLLVISAFVYVSFMSSPSAKKAKLLEVSASLYMLLMYLILLFVLVNKMEWLWAF